MARTSGNIHLAVPASSAVAGLQVMLGQLHRAAQTYQEALELALASSRTAPLAARAYSGMSTLDYEWNDLEAASRHAREAIRLGLLWGNADVLASSHAALARTLQARGDPDAARHALEEAEQLARKHHLTPGVPEIMAACRVRLWLGRGDLLSAAGWAAERQLALNDEISPLNEVEQIAVARVLVVGRQWERANSLLARLRQAAEATGRKGRLIEILAVQAAALQAQGDVTQAVATLEHGLSLAAPEGYIRTFVDEGEPMARLLRTAAARGVAPEYVRTLLAAFRDEATGDRGAPETADSVLTEPLGQRELEVLRLIDAGLSNNQIAEELCVAVSTVKKHINHIYDKLDVGSRTQALAKAREARIL